MARERSTHTVDEAKMDMTPVIDVVFNLLIFFMLTMDFVDEETQLLAHMPKNQGISKLESKPLDFEKIRVSLIKRDKQDPVTLALGTKRMPDLEKDPETFIQQLKKLTTENPQLPVIIDPDKFVEFKYVVYALNSCEAAGVQKVEFAGKKLDSK